MSKVNSFILIKLAVTSSSYFSCPSSVSLFYSSALVWTNCANPLTFTPKLAVIHINVLRWLSEAVLSQTPLNSLLSVFTESPSRIIRSILWSSKLELNWLKEDKALMLILILKNSWEGSKYCSGYICDFPISNWDYAVTIVPFETQQDTLGQSF